MAATPPPLQSLHKVVRIAMMVTAAPVVCCVVGLAVLLLLKHYQAALAAKYAARHLTPWPVAQGWGGEPSSFLHRAGATCEVLVRNPAQWVMGIGMASFVLVPALLIAGAGVVYGVLMRNRPALLGGLLPMAGLVWYAAAPIYMFIAGHEIVLDVTNDALTLNGSHLAPLSDVAAFSSREHHQPRGGADYHLVASLRGGRTVELGGPDDRPDLVAAGPALNAVLHRLRGEEGMRGSFCSHAG